MDVHHFTLSDNYAPGIPYQKQAENTHLVKPDQISLYPVF